ncbi:MAG: phage tail tape measure protein, partial [Oscillospiraceae bacterium]|nr:phage tail tape measure protein [Oscillospiraceae bacterium]
TFDLQQKQLAYNTAVAKYGEDSSQAQSAMLKLEQAETHLTDAQNAQLSAQNALEESQEALTLAQQGTMKAVATGETAFANADGSMKSLKEVYDALRSSMSAVNVELIDSEGNMRDADDIINELSQSEEGLTQAEQLKNASLLFGKQNLAGILAIINASEEDYNKLTEAIYNSDGAAKDMADTMIDNLGGDLTILSSKLQAIQIEIYEKFEPALRKIAEKVGEVMDTILEKIGDVSPVVENAVNWVTEHGTEIIAVLSGIVAGFVAFKAVSAVQNAISVFQRFASSVKTLGLLGAIGNPVGIIIAAIAGLVAAFVVLWNKSEKFRNFWIGLWESIQETLYGFFDWISEKFRNFYELITPIIQGIKKYINNAFTEIAEMFTAAWGVISAIWDLVSPYFLGIWNHIKNIFSEVGTVLGNYFSVAWEVIKTVWDIAVQYFSMIWENIKAVFSAVGEILSGFFSSAWENIKIIWGIATDFFKTVWENIKLIFSVVESVLRGNFSDAWESVKNIWNNCKTYFEKVWDAICNIFSNITNFFKNSFHSAWEAVKQVFSNVGDFFSGVWNTIKNQFSSIGTKIGDAVGYAFKTAMNAVISTIENGLNFIPNTVNGMLQLITDLTGKEINLMPTVSLPRLAKGGIVSKPTIAQIGEAGTEAIIPLERNKAGLQMLSKLLAEEIKRNIAVSVGAYGNTGTNVINNNYSFTQHNTSPKALSRSEIYRQTKNLIRAVKRS